MTTGNADLWDRFLKYSREYPELDLSLDLSRVHWPKDFFDRMQPRIDAALDAMAQLEKGAIANPDENRMVGHYWLRAPELAPDPKITQAIQGTLERIRTFAAKIHGGEIQGKTGIFKNIIVIGIGGSALGPQFVSTALSDGRGDKLSFHVLDNTDPDGMDRVLERIGDDLGRTLCIVISKSGGTKETRNGMIETKNAYQRARIDFARHAIAITQQGSALDKTAASERWLERFPMWDWVGGRTSELSPVGLVPAILQGFDIDNLAQGAREMDLVTRSRSWQSNPAMGMALAWFASGNGKGDKNLVILPYKDRLELFSKYLQQLIMESIGKELDSTGNVVRQGLSVFGNKGSTDQHSFVQQLRDGRNDFIVTFIEVLADGGSVSGEVEPGLTAGDYLQGFLLGTRTALTDNGRESITITVNSVSPFTIGALIALFERAVGFYASLIGINAYNQPGVEAGKRAATEVVNLKIQISKLLDVRKGSSFTAAEIADQLDQPEMVECVYQICRRLAANPESAVKMTAADSPTAVKFGR